MMMYKCAKCGEIFDESKIEVESWEEDRGEYFGFPARETMYEDHCPYCRSNELDEYWEEDDE